jgi:hypothetical protein
MWVIMIFSTVVVTEVTQICSTFSAQSVSLTKSDGFMWVGHNDISSAIVSQICSLSDAPVFSPSCTEANGFMWVAHNDISVCHVTGVCSLSSVSCIEGFIMCVSLDDILFVIVTQICSLSDTSVKTSVSCTESNIFV